MVSWHSTPKWNSIDRSMALWHKDRSARLDTHELDEMRRHPIEHCRFNSAHIRKTDQSEDGSNMLCGSFDIDCRPSISAGGRLEDAPTPTRRAGLYSTTSRTVHTS